MRHLPKHLRPRWRYIAVQLETWPSADVDRRSFQAAVWQSARRLLGDPGSADADLTVIQFTFGEGSGHAIVRVRREAVGDGRAALACVDAVEGQQLGLTVVGTSGTLRACEENYLSERPQASEERTVAFGGAEVPAVVRGDRLDVREDDAYTGATDLDLDHR